MDPFEFELTRLVEQGQDVVTNLGEQGKEAVSNLNRTNELMAESRLLELEITHKMFGGLLTDEQREKLSRQIEELRSLTKTGVERATEEENVHKRQAI